MSSVDVKNKSFLVFGKPDISEEEITAVTDVLRSGWIGTGKVASQLEAEFVDYMGGGYAVAVSSATIGLAIVLKACGIARNEKVLTSPLTFAATVNAILMTGAVPVFCDVDVHGCLNPRSLTEDVRAVIPVNYTGVSANLKDICGMAQQFDVPVIQDAAHSFGGTYMGKPQGWAGAASVFSFYATKNITCAEGGIIFTPSRILADRCRILSQQGQTSGAWGRYNAGPIKPYAVAMPGFKGNLPDVLAAIALTQIRRWPELARKRKKVWEIYEQEFGKKEMGHSQHLFTIRLKNRDALRQKLYEKGIGTGVHYTALHLEPAFSYLGYKRGDFPMAEMIGNTTISLPVSPTMTVRDAMDVVNAVNACKGDF